MPYFISYIPTEPELIEVFFRLAPLSVADTVYDLGCGDGRLLFTAIERGAGKAVGIEIDRDVIASARNEVRKRGLVNRIDLINGDVMDFNLGKATVIFFYLIGHAAWSLKPKFTAELREGTRIVAEMFPIPGWRPYQTSAVPFGTDNRSRDFFLYVMPPEAETGAC